MDLDINTTQPDPPPSPPLRLLLRRNFGPYFVGNLMSNMGTWIQNIALALLIFRLTGSTFLVAMTTFSQFLGLIVLAPWTGSVADRFDRRRLIVLTQVVASLSGGILALVTYLGLVTPAWLIGTALLFSITKAFVLPAQQALVTQLVERKDLQAAVALNSITFNLARAVGPVIGAGVILTLGFTWAFSINALSFLALAGAVMVVRIESPEAGRSTERTSLLETIRVVRKDPLIGPLLIAVAATSMAVDPVSNLTPAFAVEIYGEPDTFTGVLIGMFGLGAALTAAFVVTKVRATFRSISLGMAGLGVAIVAFGMSGHPNTGMVALFVGGIMYIVSVTLSTTLVQINTAEDHRGRVMALWGVAFLGLRPLASLVDGSVATLVNVRMAALVMAVPVLLGAAYLARRSRRSNRDLTPAPFRSLYAPV